jgi:hypothetical protein
MLTAAAILAPLLLLASESDSCAPQEEALRTVAHDLWLGYNRRDTSLVAKVLDNQLLFISATGSVTTKAALLTHLSGPLESMQSQSEEALEEVQATFAGHAALLNFRRRVTITHQPSSVSFRATSRMTEVFVCRGGEWKVLAFQETLMPNAERPVSATAPAHYEDYVGLYRFGGKGEGAEIRVTRKGNALYEAWGAEQPIELLPGRADAFFARGFSLEERFVRGARGQVIGIVYTMGDTEIEAKRVP